MPKKPEHPVARANAAAAAVELFFPRTSARGRERRVRKFLGRLRVASAKEVKQKAELETASAVGVRSRLGRRHVLATEDALGRREVIVHELAHFFKVGKNHLLTANAAEGYLLAIGSLSKVTMRLQALRSQRGQLQREYRQVLEQVEQVLEQRHLNNPGYEVRWGIKPGHQHPNISDIGLKLGQFAAKQEVVLGKPASGLFLVRQVCSGVPVSKAIEKIESGQLDEEIRAFARKHAINLGISSKR